MLVRPLGLLASAAVATNAILLPPEISSATINADSELAALGVVDPETQLVSIPSGHCVGRDGDCSIILKFSTAGQPKTLLINGVPFYTSDPGVTANAMNTPVMIAQLDKQETVVDYVSSPEAFASRQLRLTGSSFVTDTAEFQAESGEQVIPMSFQIYSLEGQAVNVPLVRLKVLKSVQDELMVLSVDIDAVNPMDNPEDKICADWPMFCQIRDLIFDKTQAAKEGIRKLCGGKKPGKHGEKHEGKPPHRGGPPVRLPHPHHGPPSEKEGHHGKPHRRPHGGKGKHRYRPHHPDDLSPANVVFMVVGALLMLMTTWILGYVIGTIVGYCIVGVWLLFRRFRGSPRYERVAHDEQDAVVAEEKIVNEAVIPMEDPPAYEEKEVVA